MLQANPVHIRDVEEIRRAQMRRQIRLGNFEAHCVRMTDGGCMNRWWRHDEPGWADPSGDAGRDGIHQKPIQAFELTQKTKTKNGRSLLAG